jgi:hypothetical protein
MDAAELVAAVMDPEFTKLPAATFGPPFWTAIHNITRTYTPTPEKAAALRTFMESLAVLLPCAQCSEHFSKMAPTVPTDSTISAVKWGIDTHNSVNKRLNKPVYSYAEALKLIKSQAPAFSKSGYATLCPCDATAVKKQSSAGVTATADCKYGGYIAGLVILGSLLLLCVLALILIIRRKKTTTSPPQKLE